MLMVHTRRWVHEEENGVFVFFVLDDTSFRFFPFFLDDGRRSRRGALAYVGTKGLAPIGFGTPTNHTRTIYYTRDPSSNKHQQFSSSFCFRGDGAAGCRKSRRSMGDRHLWDIAWDSDWPRLIKYLGKSDVGRGAARRLNEQFLFYEGYAGYWMCVSKMAAYKNAPVHVWRALIEAALRAGLDLQPILTNVNNYKCTVLHYAARRSDEEVVTFLAFLCPSALDMKNKFNYTPIEVAKAYNRPSSLVAALSQVS